MTVRFRSTADGVAALERFAPGPSADVGRISRAAGGTRSDESDIVNAMTVDVEDFFQVSAFEPYVSRTDWESIACRVEPNVERILAMFSDANVKGTFFTLGWVAKRFPGLVRRIVAEGHELASHGWGHYRVTMQTPEEFSADITRAKGLLEDIGGVPVVGYRAPSYSINDSNNVWAHAALLEHGHRYSSSIAPIDHDIYGWPDASPLPFSVLDNRLLEVPISTVRTRLLPGKNVACGGGGWFRLYPYALTRRLAQRINAAGERYVFYFHPWEIDPAQPRPLGLDPKTRFRHYVNLTRTERRVERLLADFSWDRMDRVFAPEIAALTADSDDFDTGALAVAASG